MKGQISTEFLVMSSFLILMFGISIGAYANSMSGTSEIGRKVDARAICLRIASAISAVASAGDGSAVVIELPYYIGDKNYVINFYPSDQRVAIRYYDGSQSCFTQTNNFTDTMTSNRTLIIKNNNGSVTIS